MTKAAHAEGTSDAKEIATSLLKLGATSYGGPAIMGIMQAELQEKRKWVSKERFLEGLSVANMLPGATATPGVDVSTPAGRFWCSSRSGQLRAARSDDLAPRCRQFFATRYKVVASGASSGRRAAFADKSWRQEHQLFVPIVDESAANCSWPPVLVPHLRLL